jgi:hypothetical protein
MKRKPPQCEEGACEGCGNRILWIVTATGARVPLDPVAPTYVLHVLNDAADPPRMRWEPANQEADQEPSFVSHFATCSAANNFSGRNKEARRG